MARRQIEINRDKLIQLLITQHVTLGTDQLPIHKKIDGITVSRNVVIEREQVLGVYTIRYHGMMQRGEKKTIGYESLLTNLKRSDRDEFLLVMAEVDVSMMLIFTDVTMDTLFGILRAAEVV